jgi:hypothetical protein
MHQRQRSAGCPLRFSVMDPKRAKCQLHHSTNRSRRDTLEDCSEDLFISDWQMLTKVEKFKIAPLNQQQAQRLLDAVQGHRLEAIVPSDARTRPARG